MLESAPYSCAQQEEQGPRKPLLSVLHLWRVTPSTESLHKIIRPSKGQLPIIMRASRMSRRKVDEPVLVRRRQQLGLVSSSSLVTAVAGIRVQQSDMGDRCEHARDETLARTMLRCLLYHTMGSDAPDTFLSITVVSPVKSYCCRLQSNGVGCALHLAVCIWSTSR